MILESQPGLTVTAEAADGEEAVRYAEEKELDLCILDVAMPRLTGLQAAREISRRADLPKILVLSMHDNEQYFFESLRVGASGYVLKSVADRDLVDACRACLRGESCLYPGTESAVSSATTSSGSAAASRSRTPCSLRARTRSSSSSPKGSRRGRSPAH